MIPVYTGSQVRTAEIPLLQGDGANRLMRLAADALAHHAVLTLRENPGRLYGARMVGLIGSGNNGGDGLFAMATLAKRGVKCTAVLLGERAHPAALEAFTRAGGRTSTVEGLPALLEDCDLLIDAVYGTGVRPGVKLPEVPSTIPVIACDLPSGVDASTGAVPTSVIPADRTVCFGALKTGLTVGSGHLVSGHIHVVDIGLRATLPNPEAWVAQGDDLEILLNRSPDWRSLGRHKYQRGVLGLLAGSPKYPGAAVITARAATSTGVGMLRTMVPKNIETTLAAIVPESVPLAATEFNALLAHNRRNGREGAARIGAWAVGPGLEDTAENRKVLAQILSSEAACVIDAGALSMIEPGEHSQLRILTPHAGELRSLLTTAGVRVSATDITEDPLRWARWAAVAYDCVILLKGSATICTSPDGYTLIVHASTPDLATAGSGDALTGLLGTLLASTYFPAEGEKPDRMHRLVDIAAAGSLIHAHAGALAALDGTLGASELIEALPRAARDLGL